METIASLGMGFKESLQLINLGYCSAGVLVGTLIGVMPGIGATTGVALLLPLSYGLPPISAIIMLAGIYYGAMYGGSTTSILLNIPGEPASVVTCFDGYPMAKQGRAGPALGIAAIGSFIAACIAIIGIALVAPPISAFALRFGPPELFAVMILGVSILAYIARFSVRRAIIMAALGVLISTVGTDMFSGTARFTFGLISLEDGVDLIPIVMGLYGIGEILRNVEEKLGQNVYQERIRNLLPSLEDWRRCLFPIFRATGIGFFCGLIPGAGPSISTFASYGMEKRISKHPQEFGNGAIEGVAGPETANNAAVQSAFIPLFTLGIPTTPTAAVLFSAFVIHGITPGPSFIAQHQEFFWTVIASMIVGNALLLVFNLPFIGVWIKLLRVPYVILAPSIIVFCIIGAYSIRNNFTDVYIMLSFGFIGYLMEKLKYEPAPMVMTLILGPRMEESLRQSLIMSGGSFNIFIESSICVIALLFSAFLLFSPFIIKKRVSLEYDQ